MDDRTLGILAGIAVGIYAFFLTGRPGRFCASLLSHPVLRKTLRLLAATVAGVLCFNIWSTAAMVVLHIAAFFLLSDIANLLIRKPAPRWRRLHGSGVLPVLLVACTMLWGSCNMNHVVQTDYTVTTQKSIRSQGYRVVFVSGLHYGTVQSPSVLRDTLAQINAQQPDFVILGGDIVEEGTSLEQMQEVFSLLGTLDAPMGIYYVYGNHDRQPGSPARTYSNDDLADAIEQNGIQILEDQSIVVNGELLLIGRADAAWSGQSSRKGIQELISPGQEALYLLTLDHQPLELPENAEAGVDLMLSGHTHAGQVFPVGYLTEWAGGLNYGLYRQGACQCIVSSGFAGWGYGIRTQGHCEYVVANILPA